MKMVNSYDDATGKVVGQVPSFTGEEMEEMVDKAYAAQVEWERVPIFEKGKILYRWMDLIDANRQEIGEICAMELGKQLSTAKIETAYTAEIGRENIEKAKHTYGEVFNSNAEGYEKNLIFTRRHPLGVVVAIIPFNYPVELTIQKAVPALMMGNTILCKASTATPLAVQKLVALAHEAGVPEDCIQFVYGDRDTCTEHLLQNPKVACLALTGSTEAGAAMMRNAATSIKNVVLELGGNDALIVTEDIADDDELMLQCLGAIIGGRVVENNGQVCASPKRILVHKDIKDRLIKGMIAILDTLPRGHAMDDAVVTRLVSETAAIKVENAIKHTVEQGGNIIYGGTREGCTIEPTIIDNVTPDMDIAQNMEVFGPVMPIITFETDEEALAIANNSIYGLSSAVFTKDMKRAMWYCQKIQASATVVNGTSAYRHHEQPFGGCKSTGIGHEGACISAEEFSFLKTYHFCDVMDAADTAMEDGLNGQVDDFWGERLPVALDAIK